MFSFVKNRYTFYAIALILLVLSLLSPFFTRLNMGIDMTGGMQIEYSVTGGDIESLITETREKTIEAVRSKLSDEERKIITDTLVYRISGSDKFVVEAGVNEDGTTPQSIEQAKTKFVTNMSASLSEGSQGAVTQSKYTNIGASFGSYIKES